MSKGALEEVWDSGAQWISLAEREGRAFARDAVL
jgi:hypothetical protein